MLACRRLVWFSDDMLWWNFKQELKNNWDHSHFSQFQIAGRSVLMQEVPFSFSRYRYLTTFWRAGTFSSNLHYRSFSAALQAPRTALLGFPATLLVSQNVSTHICTPVRTRSRDINSRKLNTYPETCPPYWENGTWEVPSQLPQSASCCHVICT